jgi:alpha-amylase/alpha-mannosidase (GH57 family)
MKLEMRMTTRPTSLNRIDLRRRGSFMVLLTLAFYCNLLSRGGESIIGDDTTGHSALNARDSRSASKTLYLNIIWHQHQPMYLDPGTDQLKGPWVRTHGTKDYYDMAATVAKYPAIHVTVNLTSSLMVQLDEYYVKRLGPCVDLHENRVDSRKYFATSRGKTDPWIDLALKPTAQFTKEDVNVLLTNVWNAFSISDVVIARFPEYRALREKFRNEGPGALSEQDRREIKFWFYLANFDPDFLRGKVDLITGGAVDLRDLVEKQGDSSFKLNKTISEDDCNRIVAETYKVLAAVIPTHKKLMYHPTTHQGQVEVITTPFYHPILPLIYDTDLAKLCQPNDSMPPRFHFPEDADAQVAMAVEFYKRQFGVNPTGMWPAEGAVAHDVTAVFASHGIQWIATDEKNLARSTAENHEKFFPYSLSGKGARAPVAIVFRDTELSDKIGFVYQNYKGEDAADDFIKSILQYVPEADEPDRLLTVILDGENAWEWYRLDNDGKEFQNALYRKLSALYDGKLVTTTTVTEFVNGNPSRGIAAHPVESMKKITWLWPGSWINANYDTWIGEVEENLAWIYLLTARNDLGQSGLKQPDPAAAQPRKDSPSWFAFKAWESMYAAEGSDWFWWYGDDQTAPGGDKPFDIAFLNYIDNVYRFARLAGSNMPHREFPPIILDTEDSKKVAQGTMAQSRNDLVNVKFQVNCAGVSISKSLYIVGNQELLGAWIPNKIKMYNDGTHGDITANDSIWTLELRLPAGAEIEYKYTNSGTEGNWVPGEEFSITNRKLKISSSPGTRQIVLDRFGKI